jgi:predicted ATP-binding protein involved in virulence
VFVGPVCSGKTSILKIVSNALYIAYKIKLRTSVVITATLTPKELYGAIEAF